MPVHVQIMVAQAGQLSGWPVSVGAGIPTPVWATTKYRA
nr:ash family protein [Serratia silvae]